MKVASITYARLQSLPNYCHHRAEVTIALEEGDTPQEVMRVARGFVARELEAAKAGQAGTYGYYQIPINEVDQADLPF